MYESTWSSIMDKLFQESAEREVKRAITADENANASYYKTLRRFIAGDLAVPQSRLDSAGLKEIDTLWIKLNNTNINLRRAYMKLYGAYL
jgi:non-ribosomal peptide synthetase component E (peptide arylation enzyme)